MIPVAVVGAPPLRESCTCGAGPTAPQVPADSVTVTGIGLDTAVAVAGSAPITGTGVPLAGVMLLPPPSRSVAIPDGTDCPPKPSEVCTPRRTGGAELIIPNEPVSASGAEKLSTTPASRRYSRSDPAGRRIRS